MLSSDSFDSEDEVTNVTSTSALQHEHQYSPGLNKPIPELPREVPAANEYPKSSIELLNEETFVHLLNSDCALDALSKRLKESINNCDEFAKYIRKKSEFQEMYDSQMKKLARNTCEFLETNATNFRQDSFTTNFSQIITFDDRLFNVGNAFCTALKTMSDELYQLSANMTKRRRMLKDEGKRKERELIESIQLAEKAQLKYYSICGELEKVKENGKKFTLKGSKSALQQEGDLHQKIRSADEEYKDKATQCQVLKHEIVNVYRPQHSKEMKDLILELDLAMSFQLQKYTTWCENLLMNSGVMISPLRADSRQSSMKHLAGSVDNEKDLYEYLLKYSGEETYKQLTPVEYKPIVPASSLPPAPQVRRASTILRKKNGNGSPINGLDYLNPAMGAKPGSLASPTKPMSNRYSYVPGAMGSSSLAMNLHTLEEAEKQSALPSLQELMSTKATAQPPGSVPIFGGDIKSLCLFEQESVPLIIRTCINIIDTYGSELEGIYRTSGNSTKILQLKEAINKDRSLIHRLIKNPDNIVDSDMYCIASLLKLYFASLPEPLLTLRSYTKFLEASKIKDQGVKKKTLHEIVFQLPDANYFTLRAIIFHLCRVAAKKDQNRMTPKSLGIIWGPNLLSNEQTKPEDLGYQGVVVESLMYVAEDIFEPET